MTEVATEAAAAPDVRTAIRLGWAVAELRGRSWPEGARPVTAELDAFYRSMATAARDGLRASLADAGAYRAMRTISYVPAVKQYAMYTVDSFGYAAFSMGQVQGTTWTFATEAGGVKYRTVIKTSAGAYTSTAEYAGADGKWVVMSETKATRPK